MLDEAADDSQRHSPLSLTQIALCFAFSFLDPFRHTIPSCLVSPRTLFFLESLDVMPAYRQPQAG